MSLKLPFTLPPRQFGRGSLPDQPVDRRARWVAIALAVLTVALLILGDRTTARVRDFSWEEQVISSRDRAFTLTFNRPMDRPSVEQNLKIDPPLPGKVGWAGRRLAYTLDTPAPYGGEYRIKLTEARDTRAETNDPRGAIAPFVGTFKTRDLAFAYIGVEGEETGRLILFNLTKKQKTLLTPKTLLVNSFEIWPDRRSIVFLASDLSQKTPGPRTVNQQLYQVPTGLGDRDTPEAKEAAALPEVERLLDNQEYQLLKFALSPDGQTIVVQRAKRGQGTDFGLWTLQPGEAPTKLEVQQGGDFRFTPDGQSIALTQGQGVAILPIAPSSPDPTAPQPASRYGETIQPLDFLPKFGTVLDFAADGSAAALVKFNGDYSRSLFIVSSQTGETEILRQSGSILRGEFSPDRRTLYALLTEVREGRRYVEKPYLAAIDLASKKLTPLLLLPVQPDLSVDLAPDGLALLFDRPVMNEEPDTKAPHPEASDGSQIIASQLWLLPIDRTADGKLNPVEPQELPLAGIRPHWLP